MKEFLLVILILMFVILMSSFNLLISYFNFIPKEVISGILALFLVLIMYGALSV